jgi:hypothetical protein
MDRAVNDHAPSKRERDDDEDKDLTLSGRLVGVVKAEHAELRGVVAGLVFAEDEAVIERGGARDVVSGGDVRITQGGAGMLLAGGDASIRLGGAGTMISLGGVDLERSGAGTVLARDVTVGRGGLVLLAITPHLVIAEGGRVLGGPAAGIAAFAGIVLGFAIGRIAKGSRR